MRVATILPQNHLHRIKYDNFHMCLAQLIGEPGYEVYTNFYKNEIRDDDIFRKEVAYLVMDNGVIEGNPRPMFELAKKAQLIGAQEFILPDVYMDARQTVNGVRDAFSYIQTHVIEQKLMVVPQGKDMDEWLDCAAELSKYPFDVWGIPKHLVSSCGRDGRLKAIANLADMDLIGDREIHLLGCWKTPLEVLTIAKAAQQNIIPEVRSVDSAIAYVYARAGLRFSDDDRPDSNAIDFANGQCDETMLAMNILAWQDSGDVGLEKHVWFL